MEILLIRISKELIFWLAWILIPILWEIIPAISSVFILARKKRLKKTVSSPIKYPEITVIVPVFNSAATLRDCLLSIYNSKYPNKMITVYLVDNGSTDHSREVFLAFQKEFSGLVMWWMTSGQGKAKALNLALFQSGGKYIIHVDSDGILEPTALRRMVNRFEACPNVQSMTGSVLIDPKKIEETKDFFMRITRRCELFEYCSAFMAGRNYEAEYGNMYTLSGAFSAFRKSVILKTFLYNSNTVGEDTHITFQIRKLLGADVTICEDAIFFVDPIENYDKLYTQRQRWQRGEIEVSHMFLKDSLRPSRFFSDFMVRILMYDHTFAFPRLIWYFAVIFLYFKNYPLYLIIGSMVILYVLYVITAMLFYLCVLAYLKPFPSLRKYYQKLWYVSFLYPLYNLYMFIIRFAGIINSIQTDTKWKTRTLTQEWSAWKQTVQNDLKGFKRFLSKLRESFNHE